MDKTPLVSENSYSRNFLDKQIKEGNITAEEAQDIYDFLGVSGIEDPNLSTKVRDMQAKYPKRFRRPDGDFGGHTLSVIRDLLTQKKETTRLQDDVKKTAPRYEFENGDTYVGAMENNIKQGIGIYTYKNGISIQGNWENDTCKKGIISYPDGTKIDGTLESISPLNAHGKMIKNGKIIYNGDIVNGKQSGNGTYYDEENGTYTGEWLDGAQHGRGSLINPKGHTIAGMWENGKLSGVGTLTRANGSIARVRMNNNGELVLAG